jgi:hypothetical protein
VEVPIVGWTYADNPFSSHPDRLEAFVADVLREELLQKPREILTRGFAGVRDQRATGCCWGSSVTGSGSRGCAQRTCWEN